MDVKSLKYNLALSKNRLQRKWIWLKQKKNFAKDYQDFPLEHLVYSQKSLILRRLGNVNLQLQENKAVNLQLASQHIHNILIKPNQVFSFWYLVGKCTSKKGYKEGLTLKSGQPSQGIGGGMCQFTNLIHWLVLHSPLDIIEHHHHNGFDLFPDYGRQIPFGTGTSIMYNYLDYQFKNDTPHDYQLLTWLENGYLCGELRCSFPETHAYHIVEEDAYFQYSEKEDAYFRHNEIHKKILEKSTGNLISKSLLIKNKAKVMYEASFIPENQKR